MALIEREALKKHAIYLHGFGKHKYVPLKVINAAPAIDAAPVVYGKWKFLNDYESRCSSCGKEIFIDHDDEYRYCPNCGARMDGGEEDAKA